MDFNNYKTAKKQFISTCKAKRFNFQKEKRNELIECSKNPQQYWKKIKKNNKKKQVENQISCNDWLAYFKTLYTDDNENNGENVLNHIVQEHDSNDLDEPISNDEIIRTINNLKANRSPGPDGICIEMFQNTINEILPFLNSLLNEIFSTGSFPPEWGESIICPIHKSGSTKEPENFRGVSLINSFVKFLRIYLQ